MRLFIEINSKNFIFDSNSVAGESSLDRLACGLGGKTVLPHIIVTVPQMLQNGMFFYFSQFVI